MLVAVASVGLIAPTAAQASDTFNLEGMNDYSSSKTSAPKEIFDSNIISYLSIRKTTNVLKIWKFIKVI